MLVGTVKRLLGVAAGFMTQEFGVALVELGSTKESLDVLAVKQEGFRTTAETFAKHIKRLQEFVTYSSGTFEMHARS